MSKIPNIRADGDVIGVGVDGNGNTIFKNLIVVINEVNQSYGLNLLTSNDFMEYETTEQDFENWKKGFSFKLESIFKSKELRRNVVDQLEKQLEESNILLVAGQAGKSKTTVMMEIICDYYRKGYKVLYSFGESELTNIYQLIRFIEGLLKSDNQVLIAIDNVQNERTAGMFYIIDKLSSNIRRKNIRFILTARTPDYDWFVKENLNSVNQRVFRDSIKKVDRMKIRFELPSFTIDEISEFIIKYGSIDNLISKYKDLLAPNQEIKSQLKMVSNHIFENTHNGHPVLVKFLILGEGLEIDVQDKYESYLTDPSDKLKIVTYLISALFEISNLTLNDQLLKKMKIWKAALSLNQSILYRYNTGIWKTLHSAWDIQLFTLLFGVNDSKLIDERSNHLRNSIDMILSQNDKSLSFLIIKSIYDLACMNVIPIKVVEQVTKIPKYLMDDLGMSSILYSNIIANAYFHLRIYKDCRSACDKAIKLDPNNSNAWNNKGLALGQLGKHEEAIGCFNEAIAVDSGSPESYYNKGMSLNRLSKYEEALEVFDQALKLDPDNVDTLNNKGVSLHNSGRYEDAIVYYEKALKIKSKEVIFINKGLAFLSLRKYEDALTSYDKVLALNPQNIKALSSKGTLLSNLQRYEEALEVFDQALKVDPDNENVLSNMRAIFSDYLDDYGKGLAISLKLATTKKRLTDRICIVEDYIKLGSYKEARSQARICLRIAKEKEYLPILEFLIITSYFLEGDITTGEALMSSFLSVNTSFGKEWNFQGLLKVILKSTMDTNLKNKLCNVTIELSGQQMPNEGHWHV